MFIKPIPYLILLSRQTVRNVLASEASQGIWRRPVSASWSLWQFPRQAGHLSRRLRFLLKTQGLVRFIRGVISKALITRPKRPCGWKSAWRLSDCGRFHRWSISQTTSIMIWHVRCTSLTRTSLKAISASAWPKTARALWLWMKKSTIWIISRWVSVMTREFNVLAALWAVWQRAARLKQPMSFWNPRCLIRSALRAQGANSR